MRVVWLPSDTRAVWLLCLPPLLVPLPRMRSVPTSTHSGLQPVPPLRRFRGMSKGSCSNASPCLLLLTQTVRNLGLSCLTSCKESSSQT